METSTFGPADLHLGGRISAVVYGEKGPCPLGHGFIDQPQV